MWRMKIWKTYGVICHCTRPIFWISKMPTLVLSLQVEISNTLNIHYGIPHKRVCFHLTWTEYSVLHGKSWKYASLFGCYLEAKVGRGRLLKCLICLDYMQPPKSQSPYTGFLQLVTSIHTMEHRLYQNIQHIQCLQMRDMIVGHL